jgi:hypothetical protein
MLRQYEAGQNTNKTVTLLKAVQWTRVSWAQCLASSTIQKCFWKSTLISKPQDVSARAPSYSKLSELDSSVLDRIDDTQTLTPSP